MMNSSRTVVCEEGHMFHISSFFLSSSGYADPCKSDNGFSQRFV